jgi:hypothetical protein
MAWRRWDPTRNVNFSNLGRMQFGRANGPAIPLFQRVPLMNNSPVFEKGGAPPADGSTAEAPDAKGDPSVPRDRPAVPVKKHKARIEHKVPGFACGFRRARQTRLF